MYGLPMMLLPPSSLLVDSPPPVLSLDSFLSRSMDSRRSFFFVVVEVSVDDVENSFDEESCRRQSSSCRCSWTLPPKS